MPQVGHIHVLLEGENKEITIRAAQFVIVTEEVAGSHLNQFLSYRALVPFDIISIAHFGSDVKYLFEEIFNFFAQAIIMAFHFDLLIDVTFAIFPDLTSLGDFLSPYQN